ncbi:GNAT family N-acetyltransferase [Rudaea sp.]|uniref:GNAT family N-acetyltransferase n=1 Tax=Rudaea sp. TaxID=2136325 RepID=UPI002ED3903F
MSYQVRQASIHDLDMVAPLFDAYRRFYAQPGDLDRARGFLRERFAHHESVILLASDADGSALGFTQLYPVFSSVRCVRAYLLNDLFVAPAARKHGVGAQLLTAAATFARANGAASMSLSTATDNAAAQHLYEALGWKRETGFLEYHLPL